MWDYSGSSGGITRRTIVFEVEQEVVSLSRSYPSWEGSGPVIPNSERARADRTAMARFPPGDPA